MQYPDDNDLRGIDVSVWQGEIDFDQVKSAGIQLVYMKATEGSDYIDPRFKSNYAGARAAGLPVGFYHFFSALTEAEAEAEADFFVRTVAGLDCEGRLVGDMAYNNSLTPSEYTNLCQIFLSRVESQSGLGVMIYSDANGARNYLLPPLQQYPLWVANYGVERPETTRWDTWAGFQYSDTGRVQGVSGYVDLDWFTSDALLDSTKTVPPTDNPTSSKRTSGPVYYTVQPGDTLSGIADKFDVTVAELVSWNRISNPNLIYAGQVLTIYTSNGGATNGGDALYTVQRGNTLSGIAERFGVSLSALIAANDISDPNLIYVGQVLRIPQSGLVSRPSASTDALRWTYVVKRGDALSRIAPRFNTTWQQLAQLNNIPDADSIYPGQVLRLYQSKVATVKPTFSNYHVVQPDDSVRAIARRYHVSESDLRAKNYGPIITGRVLDI